MSYLLCKMSEINLFYLWCIGLADSFIIAHKAFCKSDVKHRLMLYLAREPQDFPSLCEEESWLSSL